MVKGQTFTLMEESYVGEYKEGKKWNGTGYNKNGEIVVKFVNGKQREP